jgi:hypothetical protein
MTRSNDGRGWLALSVLLSGTALICGAVPASGAGLVSQKAFVPLQNFAATVPSSVVKPSFLTVPAGPSVISPVVGPTSTFAGGGAVLANPGAAINATINANLAVNPALSSLSTGTQAAASPTFSAIDRSWSGLTLVNPASSAGGPSFAERQLVPLQTVGLTNFGGAGSGYNGPWQVEERRIDTGSVSTAGGTGTATAQNPSGGPVAPGQSLALQSPTTPCEQAPTAAGTTCASAEGSRGAGEANSSRDAPAARLSAIRPTAGGTDYVVTAVVAESSDVSTGTYVFGKNDDGSPRVIPASLVHPGTVGAAGLDGVVGHGAGDHALVVGTLTKPAAAEGAKKAVAVDLYGDSLLSFSLDDRVARNIAEAGGKTLGAAGKETAAEVGKPVLMQASMAQDIVQSSVNLGGLHQANGYLVRDGRLVLVFLAPGTTVAALPAPRREAALTGGGAR